MIEFRKSVEKSPINSKLTNKRLKVWFGYELTIADFIICLLILNQLIGRHLRLIRLIHEPMLKYAFLFL